MADEPRRELDFITNLTTEQLLEISRLVGERTGFRIEQISNPIIHIHIGEVAMDSARKTESISVGNVTGSTVGAIGSAGDITIFTNHVDASSLDEGLKGELKEARRLLEDLALPKEDKDDVAESLTKLTTELQKPEAQRELGRLRRYFQRVKEIAPTISSVLSITESILKITG